MGRSSLLPFVQTLQALAGQLLSLILGRLYSNHQDHSPLQFLILRANYMQCFRALPTQHIGLTFAPALNNFSRHAEWSRNCFLESQ